MKAQSILETIGNTPHVRINQLVIMPSAQAFQFGEAMAEGSTDICSDHTRYQAAHHLLMELCRRRRDLP